MSAKKKLIVVIGVVVVLFAGFFIGRSSGSDTARQALLITPRAVERRDLLDVLTVSGEVRRDETQKINSAIDGKVSAIDVEDGETIEVGDGIFSLDGRQAVAVNGDFSFYRELSVGSVGPDVLQLENILVSAGYTIAQPDELFTEETRGALAQWQNERGYGGANPETDETVTVSLQQNQSAYSIGRANTVAFTIVPSVPSAPGAAHRPTVVTKPTLTLTASTTRTSEGGSVTYTITSDVAPTADLSVDVTTGGSAALGDEPDNGDDASDILGNYTIPAGSTSVSFSIDIYVDNVIEDDEDITVSLQDQFSNDTNYIVGSTNQTRTIISANGSDLVPLLSVTASNETVDEGDTMTFTVRTTVESNRDIDFNVVLGGSATGDADYVIPEKDSYSIAAGNTSVDINIQARRDDLVEVDEAFVFSLQPATPKSGAIAQYQLATESEATVTIQSGDLPELTMSGGGTVAEGRSGSFRITADAPVTEDTSVNYQVGGTAQNGSDFKVLTGTVTMRKGTSSVSVALDVIDDGVVFKPSDMIVADWPARVGTVEVDEGEFVLQGATVLNLTEPKFTITMKVSATDRAELEVGQKVEVDLKVGDQILDGIINELDDSASVDQAGAETYEGTIEVDSDFNAVDGATVTIDVTLDEVLNAIAVPVAAVLRSSDGDQVRVVNDQGTITRINVTIGLIDGEWAEIVEGLKGDELVVVDVETGSPAAEAQAGA